MFIKALRTAILVALVFGLVPGLALAQNQLPANLLGLTLLELGPTGGGGAVDDLLTARSHPGHSAADIHPGIHSTAASASATLASIPVVNSQRVHHGEDTRGFAGLGHFDQRYTAGTGAYANTQTSLEPPDQGLCAGNGYVMEVVNNAIAVFTMSGTRVGGPGSLSQFFQRTPEVIRSNPPVWGDFLSDPRCRFDAQSQRWFVTELEIDTDATGNLAGTKSSMLVAVSATSNPVGAYYLYSFDTTDGDGTDPQHPSCPCFGDQPLTGLDANGFYVTTNEFRIVGPGFNGAQVYALSKASLVAGIAPQVVHLSVGTTVAVPAADQPVGAEWYTLQPASAPPGSFASSEGGVEYFLSALQFGPAPYDNRLAVWALTNTGSLNEDHPHVHLLHTVVSSQSYGMEGNFAATQMGGPTPLRDALGDTDAIEQITANDDRMNQVVYAAGMLWAGVNTTVSVGGQVQQGIAWFAVAPSLHEDGLSATVSRQGYVAVSGESVQYPSIGVNAQGNAVMAFSLIGPDYWPSAAYAPISQQAGNVTIVGAGAGPDDGFTAYAAYGGTGFARWGDYTAAVADESGNIWFATEYIGQSCSLAQFALDTTCGGTRTVLANWGTFIAKVRPGSD